MCTLSPLYDGLDTRREEIRVLDIVAVAPRIQCRISKVALLDNPTFDALSYTWGDASQREIIIVNGHSVPVTKNLARAIRSVHYQWSQRGTTQDILQLWADAVCINQSDTKEKEHQIPLMRKIYTTASVVLVWLGSSRDILRNGFDAVEEVAAAESACSPLPNKEQKQFLKEWPTTAKLSHIHGDICGLFYDEYWSRVWTFQEIVLGRTVILIADDISLPFHRLLAVTTFLARYVESVDAYSQDPRSNAELWFAAKPTFDLLDVVSMISEVKESLEALELRSANEGTIEKLNFEDLSVLGYQLSRVCTLATERRASEPKDYVYGFSALLDMRIAPDYSPNTSIASIYCDLTEQALLSGGNMCLLLLDSAGIGHVWDLLPGLPSWAPNFASVSKSAAHGDHQPLIKANWASFVGLDQDRPPLMNRVDGTLTCIGVMIDRFGNIGPGVDCKDRSEWLEWMLELILATILADDSPTLCLEEIVEAALKSTSVSDHFHPPTTIFGTDTASYTDHNILLLVQALENLYDAQGIVGDKETFIHAIIPTNKHYLSGVTMHSAYEYLKSYDKSYQSQLMKGWWDICAVVRGLRIAMTSTCHFGLFPPRIQTGDMIAMFNTCTNPAVLRKLDDGYAFVGWCYISHYDGRAIDTMIKDGLGVLESIKLR
ncbi:heterokaryon incompatibility protein-domain-containing protein [Paraphoma chrysanthemicola]|uniref:Heterokaryon incompatibility protein-domain-containing protein n=1 Tax=Paraphoma chrysanthemicola TaxID=798071 RepID=A0A8K0QXN3_9PLEO|nr:heterokaryon incompatibility protein-domain-containing protein [Paraphoma chrysanthemicola]